MGKQRLREIKHMCRIIQQIGVWVLDSIVTKLMNFLKVLDILKDSEQKVHTKVHSCIIHSSQKVGLPKCPSTDEWTNEMWHILQWNIFDNKNEVKMHATTWMNLENFMLRRISQSQKTTYCMITLTSNIQNRQIYRDRMQIYGFQGLGEAGKGTATGHRPLFGMITMF